VQRGRRGPAACVLAAGKWQAETFVGAAPEGVPRCDPTFALPSHPQHRRRPPAAEQLGSGGGMPVSAVAQHWVRVLALHLLDSERSSERRADGRGVRLHCRRGRQGPQGNDARRDVRIAERLQVCWADGRGAPGTMRKGTSSGVPAGPEQQCTDLHTSPGAAASDSAQQLRPRRLPGPARGLP
jgi:hypothetical protein